MYVKHIKAFRPIVRKYCDTKTRQHIDTSTDKMYQIQYVKHVTDEMCEMLVSLNRKDTTFEATKYDIFYTKPKPITHYSEKLENTAKNNYHNGVKECNMAVVGGHLDALKLLRELGYPWDEWTCAWAAANNRLEILEWLYENGCPWNDWSTTLAAKFNMFDSLKWLHEKGCPWNEWACFYAVTNNNFEMLKWLHENDCPGASNYIKNTALNTHVE